ncbi:MAG: C25 family cysteine peptidase, partial [Bacteroidia bacterium]
HVDSVFKTSSEPIQINQSEMIRAKIDSGVTLMTFFGHSSANSFDVATDHPSQFNNTDRYHFVLANGCYAGDIHQLNESVASEDFVLTPNKGAIGFLAHPFTEYAHNFYPYSREFYNQISISNYGGTVGQSIKNTIDSIEAPFLGRKTVCLGMTLHGDPAIVLNSFQKPDYTVGNISFSPQIITTELTDFTLNAEVKNIGKATQDSFIVKLTRVFTDGSEDVYIDTLSNVYHTQTYSKVIPIDAVRGPGLNIFELVLDTANHVDEISEVNNTGIAQIVIQSNDVTPVYPYEFDIVPVNALQLKATTANPFDLTPRNYIFEVDTTDAFNSPVKQQQIVTSGGGVVSTPQLNFNFEQVYYWRVTLDDNGTYKWRESSFICKSNTTGWSQAHFYQYKKDEFYGVDYNKPTRQFDFVTVVSDLFIINSNNPFAIDPAYTINNVSEDYGACNVTPSIHIVVLDSLTHRPWEARFQSGSTILNPNNNFGNINDLGCPFSNRNRPDKYFIFRANDPAQLDLMIDLITNKVPDGNYIIAYSVFNGLFSTWQNHVYDAFEDLGADSIRYLADNQPYIFFTQKGNINKTEEVIGISTTDTIIVTLNKTLTTFWDRGFVESTRVGPATSWTSLHWQHSSLENPSKDSIHLDIIGIDNTGNETVLISGIQPSTSTLNLSSVIPASSYPYLKLKAWMKDTVFRTPPQLDYWQIYYEGVPELALNPSKFFEFYKDTVQHGENIKLAIAIENISSYNTPDSVLIDHYVYNRNKVRIPISSVRHKPLASGDTLISRIEFSSIDFPELNSLWIEANPNNDQPEQYHFNNLGELKFYAMRDVTNPVLDVTFDGVHILNGDIVSAKPHIVISLKDENKYLAVKDTSNFAVFLIHPDGRQEKLYFENSPATSTDNNLLKWYPGSLPKNSFKIEFLPYFPVDGKYELRVQAKDQSDNISGLNEYRIGFEIINKSTITQILNYPNPFSTSTRFVFTLTGSEVPTYFKIQILTVTGKIIREITSDELGPLRIGRNITEYAWNGTDEFGDKLANGLYLYRVITQIHGANIERRETEADVYFTKNFGKMYILR